MGDNGDKLVPAKQTLLTPEQFARAAISNWHVVGEGVPSKRALAVLWAQYMIETGNRYVWNYNLGNTKDVPGDGIDFHALRGTWEGVSQAEANRLISAGLATLDTNANHIKAVAPRIAVVFQPPHPATRFSAFPDLDAGMSYYLKLLATTKFRTAWPLVLLGDYRGFANALKARGYFTASAKAYADGMSGPFNVFMKSGAYEAAMAATPSAVLAVAESATAGLNHCGLVDVTDDDGVVWEVAPIYVAPTAIGDAKKAVVALGYELPTPALVDAIWRAADLKINGWDIAGAVHHNGRPETMDSADAHAAVAAKIESLVGAHGPYRLLAGAFKDVVEVDGKLGLYGWHDVKGTPIQSLYTKHALTWRDYSQGYRLVRRKP